MSGKRSDKKLLNTQVGMLVLTDVFLPFLMVIVVILSLIIGVNYVFYSFNANDVEAAALRLSQSEVKSKEALERVYPEYIVVYYDIDKRLITEEGYGNYEYKGVSYSLPSDYYGLVTMEIEGTSYLAATHTMSEPFNEKAVYVRVYVNMQASDTMKNSEEPKSPR